MLSLSFYQSFKALLLFNLAFKNKNAHVRASFSMQTVIGFVFASVTFRAIGKGENAKAFRPFFRKTSSIDLASHSKRLFQRHLFMGGPLHSHTQNPTSAHDIRCGFYRKRQSKKNLPFLTNTYYASGKCRTAQHNKCLVGHLNRVFFFSTKLQKRLYAVYVTPFHTTVSAKRVTNTLAKAGASKKNCLLTHPYVEGKIR